MVMAVAMPIVACAVQWLLWDAIRPYVWFLFFPAVFFSAWIGGLAGGLPATTIGTLLVWYVFMPPQFSFALDNPASAFSIVIFAIMGALFAFVFERLRQARQRTGEALAQANAAREKITELYQKTLELDALKSHFFANISHELRTPLTLIMSPLMKRLATPDVPEAHRHEDEMMLRSARILYRHVVDLLDVAKLEGGHLTVDYARVDLGGLVGATASEFDHMARERGIDYRIHAASPLPAEADAEKVQRILLNLLSNAFKFTPDGGSIQVRLGEEAGQAVIEVCDSGPGVPAEMRTAVFERFRQVDDGSQRRFGGTGLGLAIVKEFTELHRGSASVVTAPGGGALFVVRLPLRAPAGAVIQSTPGRVDPVLNNQPVDERQAPAPAPDAGAGVDANAPLVLVVEDNADMNAFVADALRAHYRVACAFNGREGLARALALRPDLILCDVMMPHMSGDEMAMEVRRHPLMADVPIVMLTAKADDELRVRLLEHGVQDYLDKPFSVEEMLARVGALIKERKRTIGKLTQSEARFEATFEQAAVGIALVALDGHWLRVNRKLSQIVGYTGQELNALTFQDITHPDDLDADIASVGQILAGQIATYSMEKRYFRKDGNIVWINLTVALARHEDGTPDYFIAVVEDIQRRKETEEALKASEAELKAAQRMAGIGSWSWYIPGDVHVWSEEIYRIFGRDPATPPALYPAVQQYFTAQSWEYLAAAVEAALAHGEAYQRDVEVVRADGTHRWITARGEASRDGEGKVVELHGTVQDITGRKHAEDAIRALNEDLERRVEVRTAELERAGRQFESFSYSVSHDLRAPLRTINGFASLLMETERDALTAQGREYLDCVMRNTTKMQRLIDDILAFSRVSRVELNKSSVDMESVARAALGELAGEYPNTKVCIGALAPATGDEALLKQVFANLIGNALKYSAKKDEPRVEVQATREGGETVYCVADNGAGFNMRNAESLFRVFQRLHREEEFPGSGVGLAIVKQIVERHGGRIWAEAEVDEGATFHFTLGPE